MAKNIIIQDEYYKANHMSGVTRLRTELEEGGVCYWIPEDEAVELTEKTVTENGTYAAVSDDVSGYSTVNVNVPNVYGEYDEGKVVVNGTLVEQGSRTISVNGTYDTTTNNSVTVETTSNLSTKTITSNGSYAASSDSVDGYSDVTVNVPNTYTRSDEGKVVSNSALVDQSSRTINANGTYDTTTNNSVTVETPTFSAFYSLMSRTISNIHLYGGPYTIGSYAFAGCASLSNAYFAFASAIGDFAFFNCSSLELVSGFHFDVYFQVGEGAFCNCTNLSAVTFDAATAIGSCAFENCLSLNSLTYGGELSLVSYIGDSAFKNCGSLTSYSFPTNEYIGEHAFDGCVSIGHAVLYYVSYIGDYAFNACSTLSRITIDGSSVCTLGGSGAFYGTPMSTSALTGSFGSIYVPIDLVSAYKAAPNWSFYSDRIVGGGSAESITTEDGETLLLESGEELLFDT